jgi:hypothetical protein
MLPDVVGATTDVANESVNLPQGQRRRRRPNTLSHMAGAHGATQIGDAHFCTKVEKRKRCRVCKKMIVWICKCCNFASMCPNKCFMSHHCSVVS